MVIRLGPCMIMSTPPPPPEGIPPGREAYAALRQQCWCSTQTEGVFTLSKSSVGVPLVRKVCVCVRASSPVPSRHGHRVSHLVPSSMMISCSIIHCSCFMIYCSCSMIYCFCSVIYDSCLHDFFRAFSTRIWCADPSHATCESHPQRAAKTQTPPPTPPTPHPFRSPSSRYMRRRGRGFAREARGGEWVKSSANQVREKQPVG